LNSSSLPNYLVGKFGFYMSLLPLELEVKKGERFDLRSRYQGYSSQIFKSYKVFKIYIMFLDQACNLGSDWMTK
jgi:hypothetical protein